MKRISKKEKTSEDSSFLSQLILTLEQAELKLEESYEKNNSTQFKYMKEFILKIQKKIEEELK